MALFRLRCFWCVDIGFRSITFAGMHWFYWKFAEGYITVKYRLSSILVIIRKILAVKALFRLTFCWCVDIGFRSITFAGMHWFYWKFAEGYIIVKYRPSSILVIIRKILAKLWPFFDLFFVVWVKYKVKILFPLNNFWRNALISFEVCSEGLPLGIGAIIRTSVFCCFFLFCFFFFILNGWRF